MWLKMIARNWQAAVIALLGLGLALSLSHGRYLSANLDAKIAEIDFMKREAQAFNERSNAIARQTNEQHIALVESAKKTAYANYLKKYGANAACGSSVRLPNMPADPSEADSAGEPDAGFADDVPDPVRELAEQCAETTVIATQWQAWARANDLEVQ
ncbi:MAG: hypothetical protein IPH08_04955 [Rhodocyclaceae bacterium]|nr:hypothetical protein [Rhodocyclaceae bacterium]